MGRALAAHRTGPSLCQRSFGGDDSDLRCAPVAYNEPVDTHNRRSVSAAERDKGELAEDAPVLVGFGVGALPVGIELVQMAGVRPKLVIHKNRISICKLSRYVNSSRRIDRRRGRWRRALPASRRAGGRQRRLDCCRSNFFPFLTLITTEFARFVC